MAQHTPFRIYQHNKPESWATHLERFQIWLDGRGVTTDEQKRGLLLDTLDDTTIRNLKNWIQPATLRTMRYEDIVLKLDAKITPTINWFVQYSKLIHRTQQPGESGADFMASIKELAESCNFGDKKARLVLGQFVSGLRDPLVQSKLLDLHATLTDETALTMVEMVEQAKINSAVVRNGQDQEISLATEASILRTSHDEGIDEHVNSITRQSHAQNNALNKRKLRCFRCGENHRSCNKDWKKFKCEKCLRTGHLAKVCMANSPKRRNHGSSHQREENDLPPGPSTSTHHVANTRYTQHLRQYSDTDEYPASLFMMKPQEPLTDEVAMKPIIVHVTVNGKPIPFEIDSGATCTLISRQTFNQLSTGSSIPQLYHSNIKLSTWGQTSVLKVIGKFHAQVSYNSTTAKLPVLVGEENGPNLLGRNWFQPLRISIHGLNQLSAQNDAHGDDFAPTYMDLPAVTGVGTGRYNGPPIHLELKPNTRPLYHRARPVPFALKTRMEDAINHNVEKGIWVPMPYAESWATAIVPVERKGAGALRLCGAYNTTVNLGLSTDSYQTSTTDAVIVELGSNNTVFAEIDLVDAYTQLPVDYETSKILAVNTIKGLFRVTALPFGIKLASAIFQRVVDGIIGGLPGTLAYQDNIFVAAPTRTLLRCRLYDVLKALGDAGLRVNKEKCTWETDSLEVLGFPLDRHGVRPVPSRVQAIREAPIPQNVKELQHLLGLISFYSRFFRNKATVLEPLHRLLDNGAPWSWTQQHQQALEQVKNLLSSDQVLIHYSLQLPLILAVDASSYGVGAILSHKVQENGATGERPIQYASRTLTQTERRYSQLDKEALAVIFGISKFNQFLQARSFTIVTDHKPLTSLFDPTARIPLHVSPRILRWILMLSAYDYKIIYKPGSAIANVDYLSRSPLPAKRLEEEVIPGGIYLFEAKDLEALSPQDIASATKKDPTLRKVMAWTQNGWPENVPDEFRTYWRKRDELSIVADCLLRNNRVVIPCALRPQVLQLIHSSHFGENYSKAVARAIVWWPNVDTEVADQVKTCEECQSTRNAPARRVVSPWPPAQRAWERVHLDYAGPIDGNNFLVAIDSYSLWPVVKLVANLTTSVLIVHMRYMFAEYGKPELVVSDNGRQFVSKEFEEFLRRNGVRHVRTPPWHPASNGIAERTVQTFKRFLSKFQKGDIHTRLARILWSMRTSPCAKDGKMPAELIGRPFNTHLSQLHPGNTTVKPPLNLSAAHCPGECVWILKHTGTSARWIPGVVLRNHGTRVYDVKLPEGTVMTNISADHVRRRFVEDTNFPVPFAETAVATAPLENYPSSTPNPGQASARTPTPEPIRSVDLEVHDEHRDAETTLTATPPGQDRAPLHGRESATNPQVDPQSKTLISSGLLAGTADRVANQVSTDICPRPSGESSQVATTPPVTHQPGEQRPENRAMLDSTEKVQDPETPRDNADAEQDEQSLSTSTSSNGTAEPHPELRLSAERRPRGSNVSEVLPSASDSVSDPPFYGFEELSSPVKEYRLRVVSATAIQGTNRPGQTAKVITRGRGRGQFAPSFKADAKEIVTRSGRKSKRPLYIDA